MRSKARLIIDRKTAYADGFIIQVRVWAVPAPVPPSGHGLKYSLFYGRPGERLIGYDNERGKGDHKHIRESEFFYEFVSVDRLIDDFMTDVDAMRSGKL